MLSLLHKPFVQGEAWIEDVLAGLDEAPAQDGLNADDAPAAAATGLRVEDVQQDNQQDGDLGEYLAAGAPPGDSQDYGTAGEHGEIELESTGITGCSAAPTCTRQPPSNQVCSSVAGVRDMLTVAGRHRLYMMTHVLTMCGNQIDSGAVGIHMTVTDCMYLLFYLPCASQ